MAVPPEQAQAQQLRLGRHVLPLSRPLVMGVLNVTPDSFSDGGAFVSPETAIRQAQRLVAEGADIIDIGGESTRPGSQPVSVQEELDRVLPVLEAVSTRLDVPVSVDTCKPAVMSAAASAGAGLLNDVYGLRAEGAVQAAAATGLPVCVMHMKGEPRTMQHDPRYAEVVDEVREFLLERVRACEAAGIPRERLILDPGFGFGKTLDHNYRLLGRLDEITGLGMPVLVGMSRKSMLGGVTGRPLDQRLAGGLAAAVVAVTRGARIVRAHDVAPMVDALRVAGAALDAAAGRTVEARERP
ncbi:dihydropteroate synthase [Alkalispirillum mobile]|uniref:Dihydropteroate synthase n=1 Tax=Alkalispirillum mobile TaxID=85925 RepID=A0A498C663_9GAMM|nr:dihydropteroate synthase [Alkalispirillum mobile]RLK50833.1 dihydropteroate synthase [Alkalispirillum mobile]